MALPKHYDPRTAEPHWQARWQETGVYHFSPEAPGPVYSIDTPPPTVSGFLHLGHTYSYSHTDFMARFFRMNGYNVFYPMGYDDNGLPTERLVERKYGVSVAQAGRQAFVQKCLEISAEIEQGYQAIWQRLGLSIDWRYTYRTIDALSQRTAQLSFLDLYRKGLVYRQKAPTIWCTECHTGLAQADLNDLEQESEFLTLAFGLEDGGTLAIATTRPELLPACVAVFVHPDDGRFRHLLGQRATVPLFGQQVPILTDPAADPEKGTGAVMCCTFGDVTDVQWWYTHSLPLVEGIDRAGRLTAAAGEFAGLPTETARDRIAQALAAQGLLLGRQPLRHSVRVHERCDTPVEYMITRQWFIRILENRARFLEAGEQVAWHPEAMAARYRQWVENLNWDWCISRQRAFGIPFPLWYCDGCGEVVVAEEEQLPVDPLVDRPAHPCACGSTSFTPERDILDTWATSSLTPQLVGQWLTDPALYGRVFPMSLRPQAHEIIRTWAFYTIVKSLYHFDTLPWRDVAISGWGLAPEGTGKISKSRGGGPMPPLEAFDLHSADAVRYWAASTGLGKDAVISEEKIQAGARLVTKLWNVARFSERFLAGYTPPAEMPPLSPADRWILSRTQRLIRRVTELFQRYDYAAAKSEVETFFWRDLADNYLEMAKLRLYGEAHAGREGARCALHHVLLVVLKLFAPILPYVTEEIYQGLFAGPAGGSIHRAAWPISDERLEDDDAEAAGEALVAIATAVRRYKSEHNLPLSNELARLQLAPSVPALASGLLEAEADLMSITRARQIDLGESTDPALEPVPAEGEIAVALVLKPAAGPQVPGA
jgi:valyl-tRNA synthetase